MMRDSKITVKIAPPFAQEGIDKIRISFEKLLGHPITLKIEEDKSLIGGFCAFADGKVYDASIKARLLKMRQNLSQ